jgi:hypothetical protein
MNFFDSEFLVSFSEIFANHLLELISAYHAEDEFDINYVKIMMCLCKFGWYTNGGLAVRIVEECLRVRDIRVFSAVVELCFGKGIEVLAAVWELLLKREDQACRIKLAHEMCEMWGKCGYKLGPFLALPGVTKEEMDDLGARLSLMTSDRGKRRCFRLFLMG